MTAGGSDVCFRWQSGHPLGLDECLQMTHVRHCAGTAAVSLVDRLYYGPFHRTEAVNDDEATT